MTDDTKALVDKHGCLRYLAAFQSTETKVQLDDLRSLLADRDALAAENARLREALRSHVVGFGQCFQCDAQWDMHAVAEHHAPDCLAAPKEET